MDEIKKNIFPENPYRGIHPFEFIHRKLFFGREDELTQLFSKILFSRFVLLFGESGSGKSSLINAGLIPRLLDEGFSVEKLRIRPIAEEPLSIRRININTEENPEYLTSQFCEEKTKSGNILDESIPCNVEKFSKVIREKSLKQKTVLIFDQFEELFTLFSASGSSDSKSYGVRDEIFNLIYNIASDKILPIKIIVLIREDFLGELEVLSKDYPQVFEHRIRLRNLNFDSAKRAILGPFESEHIFSSRLTEKLADKIINDLLADRNDDLIHPTHLQIICSRLWETYSSEKTEIDEKDYLGLGAIKGILESFLKTEIDKATVKGLHDECIQILGNLITEAETRDVVSLEKLTATIDIENAKIEEALELMVNQRLLNKTSQRETFYFEVASEYLIPPILKEANQLKQEQALLEAQKKSEEEITRRGLEIARQVEEEAQRKYMKRLKRLLVILTVLLCITVISTVEFFFEKNYAEEINDRNEILVEQMKIQKKIAEQKAIEAFKQENIADSIRKLVQIKNDSLKVSVDSVRSKMIFAEYQKTKAERSAEKANRYLEITKEMSETQRKIANSHELALKALNIKDEEPQNALYLALYALGEIDSNYAIHTYEAENALQNIRSYDYPLFVEIVDEPITSIVFHPKDDNVVVIATTEGKVITYSYAERKVISVFQHNDLVEDVAFSADGNYLITACRDCKVRIFTLFSSAKPFILCEGKNIIHTIAVSNDNKWIATGSDDGSINVWDFSTKQLIKTLLKSSRSISTVNFSPDNLKFIAAGWDSILHVWDTNNWKELYSIKESTPVQYACFSPDSRHFVITTFEKVIEYRSSKNGGFERWFVGHDAAVNSAYFSPDQKRLVSAGSDNSVIFWEIETSRILWKISEYGRLGDIALSGSGKRFATTLLDEGIVYIYYTDIEELVENVKTTLGNFSIPEEDKRKYIR